MERALYLLGAVAVMLFLLFMSSFFTLDFP